LWNVAQVLGFVNIGCMAAKLLVAHSHERVVMTRKMCIEQNIVTRKSFVFWDITPYSPLKKSTNILNMSTPSCRFVACFRLVSCLTYTSILKM
jgi:hypothetical protein